MIVPNWSSIRHQSLVDLITSITSQFFVEREYYLLVHMRHNYSDNFLLIHSLLIQLITQSLLALLFLCRKTAHKCSLIILSFLLVFNYFKYSILVTPLSHQLVFLPIAQCHIGKAIRLTYS